ncbi:MAG: lysozyme inhibitor LprI family protein [Bacteroidota bacterium]
MKNTIFLLFTVLLISCNKQEKPKTIVKYIKVKETSTKDSLYKKFDCYDGSQLEMNICSLNEFRYYDSILNVKYKAVINQLDKEIKEEIQYKENYSSKLKIELVKSQKEWIKLKESNMAVYNEYYNGGSMRPLAINTQGIHDTKDRIEFLDNFVSN